MKDFLKSILSRYKIKVIYTDNKKVILSAGSEKGMPVVRAHSLFKNCTRAVAKAICDYYMQKSNSESSLSEIRDYVLSVRPELPFRIIPPHDHFTALLDVKRKGRSVKELSYESDDIISCSKESSFELKISHMEYTDSAGNKALITSTQSIKADDNEFIELDITVDNL